MKRVLLLAGMLMFVLAPCMSRFVLAQAEPGRGGNTFYDIIKHDHKLIEDDFQKVKQETDNDRKKEAFNKLTQDLLIHMKAEESYWYPVLQENQQTSGLAIQAKDEHAAAVLELNRISGNWNTEPPRLDEAEKMINEHIKFEESKMFDESRKLIKEDQGNKIFREFKNYEKAAAGQ
jgi:hemerythrin superfamily protein